MANKVAIIDEQFLARKISMINQIQSIRLVASYYKKFRRIENFNEAWNTLRNKNYWWLILQKFCQHNFLSVKYRLDRLNIRQLLFFLQLFKAIWIIASPYLRTLLRNRLLFHRTWNKKIRKFPKVKTIFYCFHLGVIHSVFYF